MYLGAVLSIAGAGCCAEGMDTTLRSAVGKILVPELTKPHSC